LDLILSFAIKTERKLRGKILHYISQDVALKHLNAGYKKIVL